LTFKKRKRGYPLANTIFEDTRRAVLYQNKVEVERYDLTKAQGVADLLTRFYSYSEPDYVGFEQAIEEFKDRVPELAAGLVKKIEEAHKKNKKFQDAFDTFFTLCQTALNPNIRQEAVDEMLVQHLLTERLFRKIFHDEEFTKRNVIAAEVENLAPEDICQFGTDLVQAVVGTLHVWVKDRYRVQERSPCQDRGAQRGDLHPRVERTRNRTPVHPPRGEGYF
jgi:hypothetical protein